MCSYIYEIVYYVLLVLYKWANITLLPLVEKKNSRWRHREQSTALVYTEQILIVDKGRRKEMTSIIKLTVLSGAYAFSFPELRSSWPAPRIESSG